MISTGWEKVVWIWWGLMQREGQGNPQRPACPRSLRPSASPSRAYEGSGPARGGNRPAICQYTISKICGKIFLGGSIITDIAIICLLGLAAQAANLSPGKPRSRAIIRAWQGGHDGRVRSSNSTENGAGN